MLRRGEVFGTPTASADLCDATLTEARYEPGSRLPEHEHELPMFVLVVDGGFAETFDRYERTCGPRDLLFRPPGERHRQRFSARGATRLTIEIPALMDEMSVNGPDGRLPLHGKPALYALRIYDELKRPTADTSLMLEELIVNLGSFACKRSTLTEARPPAWLGSARELVESRFMDSVRLADIASEIGVHRVHLSRTFRRFLGCGIAEYVRRLRVHAACTRLRILGLRGSLVAAEVGFSDESHMGRTFREVMHCSPREYRSTTVRPEADGGGPGSLRVCTRN